LYHLDCLENLLHQDYLVVDLQEVYYQNHQIVLGRLLQNLIHLALLLVLLPFL
jgi:hypothetical protein